jgi:Uma2 family endonuclease
MGMLALKRQWTIDDLEDLPDNDGNRYEIIDGELFVTPAPAWPHQTAIAELYSLLRDYLSQPCIGYAFFAPADVIFSPRRVVEPDIFVVPPTNSRRPKSFAEVATLLLAVEVLSPSTARADRIAKRALFRSEGVAEYWIVDLDARVIERSTPNESRPEVLSERLEWTAAGATESLVIDLVDYFARVLDD